MKKKKNRYQPLIKIAPINIGYLHRRVALSVSALCRGL
uniref:Uncharacterized protein n=1 Tax=Anguilla anguilla TaxID=7936 RepID=A0A0E9RIC3_ANGAN